ncbi:hypothetical protein U9M48_020957 [Paspalum notatum var. saurae]|uniref:C3H1-type domain-containing protein n=1 Tax=Paspalum notatum var. saurae TaxID=547442 RepID=A0AAQ3TJE9_PASNO
MENEGGTADGAASRCWEASPNGVVIVLPAGSAAPRQPPHLGRLHQQREAEREREREMQQHPGAGAGGLGEHHLLEPPEKVFYKTKLCDKFEAVGKCAYEDGCTFAHGQGELRPPLPVPPALIRRRPLPPPPPPSPPPLAADTAYYAGGGGYYGKVCFEFRDKGTCHFGDRCAYAHATAAEIAEMRYPGGPRSVEHALRNSRAPSPLPAAAGPSRSSSSSTSYAPPPRAFAFPSVPAIEDGRKVSRLELLSGKKLGGIYGDWPVQD